MAVQHDQQLLVWQKAMDLAVLAYAITRLYPRCQLFGLTSQVQRAAASIPANIAEGHSRAHTREFLNHLSMARGSLSELETHLILSQRIGRITEVQLEEFLRLSQEVGRMLIGLRKSVEGRL
ncbi:MAG: four helix bundle protein [Isosphaeraceae bacterium]